MTKFYAQEKRVFDINKVTVVGSPTITSDGVASGFSSSDYLQKGSILPTEAGHNYIFKTRYKHITNNFSETGYMFNILTTTGNYFGAVARSSTKTISFVNTITGSPLFFNSVALVEGKTYDIEYHTDFSTYAQYYVDGDLKKSLTYSVTGYPTTGNVLIGITSGAGLPLTMGSIDLTAFKIYVDGELVYSPTKPICYLERRKEGFDLSKFTVVGTPTITDEGFASGLNAQNYVSTGVTYADIKDKSWKISTQAFVGTVNSTNNASVILLDNAYRTLGSVFYNAGLKFCARFGDSSSSTAEIYVASLGVVPEGWYNISLSFDIVTGVYTLYAKNLETNKEYKNTYTPTTENKQLHSLNTKSEATVLRVSSGGINYSLDCNLSQFSITIDGKEVFTGAKEKFYAMRGM